jgi:hypothetical protein
MSTINIATDFTRYPAGRYAKYGNASGETFRETLLVPMLQKGEQLKIVLDGTIGYGSSFLEEAFGGLIRKGFSPSVISEQIEFISTEDPTIPIEILEYVKDAASHLNLSHRR